METNNTSKEKVSQVPEPVRGHRVLVVDYDTASLLSIASVLEKHFYKVTTTELASVALSMFEEREYDLVMADVNMPEMDALMFMRKIQLRNPNVTIILTSQGSTMNMAKKALTRGASFVFDKPMRTCDLINLWQHILRKRNILKMIDKTSASGTNSEEAGGNTMISSTSSHMSKRIVVTGNGNDRRKLKRKLDEGAGTHNVVGGNGSSSRDNRRPKQERMTWTYELHAKFLDAVEKLRQQNLEPHPKAVLSIMNDPKLTHRNVSSHLQKFKKRQKYIEEKYGVSAQPIPMSVLTNTQPCSNYLQINNAANTTLRARRWVDFPMNLPTNNIPGVNNGGGGRVGQGIYRADAAANNTVNPSNANGQTTDVLGFYNSAGVNPPVVAATTSYPNLSWYSNQVLHGQNRGLGMLIGENASGSGVASGGSASQQQAAEAGAMATGVGGGVSQQAEMGAMATGVGGVSQTVEAVTVVAGGRSQQVEVAAVATGVDGGVGQQVEAVAAMANGADGGTDDDDLLDLDLLWHQLVEGEGYVGDNLDDDDDHFFAHDNF